MADQTTGSTKGGRLAVKVRKPQAKRLWRSYRVLESAIETCKHLLNIYDALQVQRGGGAPKTEEQDLLRTMVVMAAAGLDGMLKQLDGEALIGVIQRSTKARTAMEEYLSRRLSRGADGGALDARLLARLLMSSNPVAEAVSVLLEEDVRGRSMQSYEQLMRVLGYLGVSEDIVRKRETDLRNAFKTRNQIVHEMDVEESSGPRIRRPRQRKDMLEKTHALLEVASGILREIDAILSGK